MSPETGLEVPGPIGVDEGSPARGRVERIITAVLKDWVPPSPRTTPAIQITGATLAAAAAQLDALPEWGEGGGSLRTDRVPVGTSPTVTVQMRANLVFRMPTWTGYGRASAAARAEWDRMIEKLRIHEQRHVDIAIEEADSLAAALIGREIGEIPAMVTDANRTLANRQQALDDATDHGARAGVPYGDVTLDASIA